MTTLKDESPLDDKTFQWLIGLVLTAILAIGSFVYSSLDRRLAIIEGIGSPPMRERIAKLESENATFKRDIDEIKINQREILTLLREHMEKNGIERNRAF